MTEHLDPPPRPEALPERTSADTSYGCDDLILRPGSWIVRIYSHAGRHPQRWWEFRQTEIPTPGRFDALDAVGVDGVCYLAIRSADERADPAEPSATSALPTCLAEVLQNRPVLDRLDERSLVIARLTSVVTVLDASSDWAARAGAGAHLSTAPKHLTSQWATAIAQRWPDLQGMTWISSVRPQGRALALWSPRARQQLAGAELFVHRSLADPSIRPELSWAASELPPQIEP